MKNILEYEGFWYGNNNLKDKVYGTLKIEQNGKIKLKIYGCLKKLNKQYENLEYNTINGVTSNGKKITLINSYLLENTMSSSGFPTNTYSADYIIEGEEYKSLDDIKIKNIESRYTGLNKWIGVVPFKIEYKDEWISVNYKLPNQDIYKLKDYTVKINFENKSNHDRFNKIQLYQKISIIFDKESGYNIKDGLEKVYDFSKFLTLCIGERSFPYEIRAIDINNNKIKLFRNGTECKKNSEKDIKDILIPYSDIKDNFTQCLENWDKKKELMNPIIDYVVEAHEEVFYIPMTFLNLVQATEAFSRRMRNNCIVNAQEHHKKIDYIISSVEKQEYKEWVEEKLRYSNEPTLRNRLQEIFKETNFLLELNSKKRKSLISKIIETRNYFTHFDENKKDKIMTSDEIFYVSKYILFVLRALIMKEFGINEEIIKNRITKSSIFNYIKYQIR